MTKERRKPIPFIIGESASGKTSSIAVFKEELHTGLFIFFSDKINKVSK